MMQTEQDAYQPFIPHDVAHMVDRQKIPLVKAWRIRLGMTIEEIASAAKMHPEEVSMLEKKHNKFSTSLVKVACAMNLDIDQLMDNIQ